jgi:hypothetical protein
MKNKQKFKKILKDELENTKINAMCGNSDGSYFVFGKYRIIPHDGSYGVIRNNDLIGYFGSTRSALSWCVADKYEYDDLAREIKQLDGRLLELTNDIHVRSAIAKSSKDIDLVERITFKLESKLKYKADIQARLNKCIMISHFYQTRGFTNEIERTVRA